MIIQVLNVERKRYRSDYIFGNPVFFRRVDTEPDPVSFSPDPYPVFSRRSDPDPVKTCPDPQPCLKVYQLFKSSKLSCKSQI